MMTAFLGPIQRLSRPCLSRVHATAFLSYASSGSPTSGLRRLPPHEALLSHPPRPPEGIPSLHMKDVGALECANTLVLEDPPSYGFTLLPTVHKLSVLLRNSHRRKIPWPINECSSASNIYDYLRDLIILRPASILNHLRNRTICPQIKCFVQILDTGIPLLFVTREKVDYDIPTMHFPVFIFLPRHLLDGEPFTLTRELDHAVRQALALRPWSKIICTDHNSLLILYRPSPNHERPENVLFSQCTKIPDLHALRIVVAAYIYECMKFYRFMEDSGLPDHLDSILPHGPMNNPTLSIARDEGIRATCDRHSDFDLVALTRDHRRALQFFRWKAWVRETLSPEIVFPGDTVVGEALGFARQEATLTPFYDMDEVPDDIACHIQSVQRLYPIGLSPSTLAGSQSFSLRILEELTPERTRTRTRLSRVYTCQIVSIDRAHMGADSPVLCLKLFDDRFLHMDDPRDDGYSDEEPPGESELEQWWNRYENEENGVRCEDMTYERLRFMQGSLLPWYYGAHRFTLPGWHTIYGILMEYVGGVPLGEGHAAHLPPQQQVELINSLRLAVRGMEHADVSQHDWHRKQILVSARSTSDGMLGPSVHCVLVDFSLAPRPFMPLISTGTMALGRVSVTS